MMNFYVGNDRKLKGTRGSAFLLFLLGVVGSGFGFLPEIVALGVVDRTKYALFGKRYVFADMFDQVFCILPLRKVVLGAGVVHDWDIQSFARCFDVVLFEIDERTD